MIEKRILLFWFALLAIAPANSLMAQAGCIEHAIIRTVPVQCNTFRNGFIYIDSVKGGTPPLYYSLDGTTFSTRSSFDLLWPGNYTVTIQDTLGCTFEQSVLVEEPPVLKVNLQAAQTEIDFGDPVQLYATYEPADAVIQSVRWRPPEYFEDGNKYEQVILSLKETTTFAVEIVDKNECTARDQVVVSVNVPNIFIPNVISVGSIQDAYFTVFSDENVAIVKSLKIYSRGGSLVFEREQFPPNDPLLGWNGRVPGGLRVQPAVFVYVAEIMALNGDIIQKVGTLTVLR